MARRKPGILSSDIGQGFRIAFAKAGPELRSQVASAARATANEGRYRGNDDVKGQFKAGQFIRKADKNRLYSVARQFSHDAAQGSEGMDAGTRKAMKNHYYREGRRANGLSAG